MNKEYLGIFKIFLEKNLDKLSNETILKMSYKLLNYFDCMNKLNIDDENLLKNGRELTKIYFKKIFQNILKTIENILKSERELKEIKMRKEYIILAILNTSIKFFDILIFNWC